MLVLQDGLTHVALHSARTPPGAVSTGTFLSFFLALDQSCQIFRVSSKMPFQMRDTASGTDLSRSNNLLLLYMIQ